MAKGLELGTESSPQQDLLEEVTEAKWLLRKIWQSVEGVWNQTWRMVMEAERAEVQRELEELQEEAEGHCDESSEDSELSGLWRTGSKETEEWESERWRSPMDLESEGSEKEVDKEVEEEMTLQ